VERLNRRIVNFYGSENAKSALAALKFSFGLDRADFRSKRPLKKRNATIAAGHRISLISNA